MRGGRHRRWPRTPATIRSADGSRARARALGPGEQGVGAAPTARRVILVHVGAAPLAEGMNILGAHIDSPRLDLKQNPLYESERLRAAGHALLRRHQELPVGHAAAGAARRRWPRTDGTRGGGERRRGRGRPGVLRDRPAHPPGVPSRWTRRARRSWKARTWTCSMGNRPLASDRRRRGGRRPPGKREGDKAAKDPVKAVRAGASGRQVRHRGGGLPLRRDRGRARRPRPRPRASTAAWSSATARTTACAPTPSLAAQLALADDIPATHRLSACWWTRRRSAAWAPPAWRRMFFENTIAEIMDARRREQPAARCAAL